MPPLGDYLLKYVQKQEVANEQHSARYGGNFINKAPLINRKLNVGTVTEQ